MENSIEGKFGNIYKLLSLNNFQSNFTDEFKCMKCQNVLINACITACGCQFCRKCVEEMLLNDIQKCPGNTTDCKNENLSNILTDHRMNLKISKLSVKCPEQMCGYECQLMEMEEHMRLCSKKSVQCPCHDLGCHDDNLVMDKINEHLQTDSYNHWAMLMRMNGDLRNEVAQLRTTDNTYKNEIEMLKEEGRAKDVRIEAMKNEMMEEIRKCQVETEMLRRQIDIGKETVDSKINSMTVEMNGQIESINTETNKSLKMEMAELSGQLGNLNGKLEGIRVEVDGRLDETRQGCMMHVEGQLDLINGAIGKYQEEMVCRMDRMEIWLAEKFYGTRFVWPVNETSQITWLSGKPSEYFFPKSNKYKMQLQMSKNNNSKLLIYFSIHHGPNDASLQWPFQANVTVKLTNKAHPSAWQVVTKYCKIDRPQDNLYNCTTFHFPIADLSSKGLLQDDCCIVEGLIDIE